MQSADRSRWLDPWRLLIPRSNEQKREERTMGLAVHEALSLSVTCVLSSLGEKKNSLLCLQLPYSSAHKLQAPKQLSVGGGWHPLPQWQSSHTHKCRKNSRMRFWNHQIRSCWNKLLISMSSSSVVYNFKPYVWIYMTYLFSIQSSSPSWSAKWKASQEHSQVVGLGNLSHQKKKNPDINTSSWWPCSTTIPTRLFFQ